MHCDSTTPRVRTPCSSALARGTFGVASAFLFACATPGTPRIDGSPGAPAGPRTPWPEPPQVRTPPPPPGPPTSPAATNALHVDSATAGGLHLSLTDVVDLALRNNPATRNSWALAEAAANDYGSARGARYPTLNASLNLTATANSTGSSFGGSNGPGLVDTTATGTGNNNATSLSGGTVTRVQTAPAISLSYLVFDFGGRAGTIESAKQRAIAANLTHNSTINDVVLQVESALFSFLATNALRNADLTAINEAQGDTAASEARMRVGVGTLQDGLQARTELAQAHFQLATDEGALESARGNLAAAMGLPANARFDIPKVSAKDSVATVAASVDTLINRAIAQRPDLAESRAEAAQLAAQIRIARSAGYPALTLTSTNSVVQTLAGPTNTAGRNSSIVLGLQIPVFNGFSYGYNSRSAEAQYQAGLARLASTRQQVTVQVFASYAALKTAQERIAAARELLRSATQSADVATGRYREGVGTIVDVLLARTALDQARAEDIQARWEWRTALTQLAHDVGSLDANGRPNIPLGTPPGR